MRMNALHLCTAVGANPTNILVSKIFKNIPTVGLHLKESAKISSVRSQDCGFPEGSGDRKKHERGF